MVTGDWASVRQEFRFPDKPINFSAMAMASTPERVRKVVDDHRLKLDLAPYQTQLDDLSREETEVCKAIEDYFGVPHSLVAITSGTTLGLSLLFAGIKISPGQEVLTTQHEFTRSLTMHDLRRQREGTLCRKLALMPEPGAVSVDSILAGLKKTVCSHTRVLALQWVYSNTGVKMPIAEIAEWVRTEINPGRADEDRVLLCVDGVHGFGVEAMSFGELGCDFFVSGCHKWTFGPRGSGIWCGTETAWGQYLPISPNTSRKGMVGLSHSPPGVQAYEHWWALDEAFRFLMEIGPKAIMDRVHELASLTKEGLAAIPGVTVITPRSPRYSSGIVCFDIAGIQAKGAVDVLLKRCIRASVSSVDNGRPDASHVRLSLAIFNSVGEVNTLLKEVELLARGCQ